MMSKIKYVTFILLAIINGGSFSTINTVSAATTDTTENKVQQVEQSSDQLEDKTVTLQELIDTSNLTQEEKIVVTNSFLNYLSNQMESQAMTRSRYYTIHQDLSNSKVKKIVNSSNPIQLLSGFIPYAGVPLSIIYYNYYNMYSTAAMNGWGIRITITSDSYNPTSTGTTFKISYLK